MLRPLYLGRSNQCDFQSMRYILFLALTSFLAADPLSDSDQMLSSISSYHAKVRKENGCSRSDAIPKDHVDEETEDAYLEGYIQALIDANYYEFDVLVYVENHTVYLYNMPNNALTRNSIIAYVCDVPEVEKVCLVDDFPQKKLELQEKYVGKSHIKGVWFPQTTVLFQPLIADPKEPMYMLSYRWGDRVMGQNTIAFSMGDTFPIYRFRDVFPARGDLEIGIAACVWAVFNMNPPPNPNHETSEMMNADYMLAIPFSYAFDRWSFRLRFYHVSSHLGDEYLFYNPGVQRLNPSMEAVDLYTSYQLTQGIRLYGGPGWCFHSDNTFPLKPFYIEYGTEIRAFGTKMDYHQLYGTPFLAINVTQWQTNHWRPSFNGLLGYEWSKLQGVGRKIRVFLQYYNGYSEGQFFKEFTSYGGVGFSYGF